MGTDKKLVNYKNHIMSSNRTSVTGFGFSKEVADKLDSKYKLDDEKEINNWLSQLGLGSPSAEGKDNFQKFLRSGVVLCQLANILEPGGIRKIHNIPADKTSAMLNMKMQENISFFLKWARNYGLQEADSFQTASLFDGGNLAQVQMALYKVGSIAKSKNFSGPTIGVVVSSGNKRTFTAEQLKAGQHIPSMQSGNNKGASQAGQTPYGLGRQIIDNQSENYKADYNNVSKQTTGPNRVSQAGTTAPGTRRQILYIVDFFVFFLYFK